MEHAYPPLSVEEIEDLLARRIGPSRRETRSLLVRALTTAKQLRELRFAYDLEMRARVAAAGAGRRAYLDPSQVISFLSAEQRSKLLTQMEKDRLEAHERLNQELSERIRRLSDLIITAETLLADTTENAARGVAPLLDQMREELGTETPDTKAAEQTEADSGTGTRDEEPDETEEEHL